MTASRDTVWRTVWLSITLAVGLALGLAPAAFASTINVDGNCVDTNLADAICDDAVTYRTIAGAATAAIPNDTINITTVGPHTEYGLTFTKTLTLQGQGPAATIWQGAGSPGIAASRMFTVNPGASITVTALTLRYGNSTGSGGAIYNRRGTLTLDTVNVLSNTAATGGGAIYNEASTGAATVWITGTLFSGNTTPHGSQGGGALWNNATSSGAATANIVSSQFVSNTAIGGGGAIYSSNSSASAAVRITDTLFLNNHGLSDFYGGGGAIRTNASTGTNASTIDTSQFISNTTLAGGGAIYQDSDAGTATLTVTATLFRANAGLDDFYGGGAIRNFSGGGTARARIESSQLFSNTTAAGGGALANDGLDANAIAYLEVVSSTLAYNTAADRGGAIYNYDYNRDGPATLGLARTMITGTLLYSNTAGSDGGGLFSGALDGGSFAVVTALNSTFSGNQAGGAGGGLYNDINNRDDLTDTVKTSAVLTLTHVTIANNFSSGAGGGLYVAGFQTHEYSRADLRNSLITGNSGAECSGAGDVAGEGNFIDDTTCGSGGPFRLGSAQGTLQPLANNGGPTDTHALANTSPAVDATGAPYCPASDQRGTARPQGAACDAGAWEGVPASITLFIAANPPDGTVGQAYTYTVTSNGFPVTITLQAGTLPPGLTLTTTGLLTGTPTITGTFSGLVFRATNNLGFVDSSPQTIVITELVHITANPPDGQVGAAYSYALSGSGNPLTYTLQSGTLPPGLTLSASGLLTGTPTLAGTYSGLVFRADNGSDTEDSSPQTIEITDVAGPTYTLRLPLLLAPDTVNRR